jgi:protein associated with RNAse G/E
VGGFEPIVIKSFKHDGHLHRMWLQNWAFPRSLLHPDHINESMTVTINSQTRIQESDGKEWTSRIPGISFFVPAQWYNIVALIEENGVRYYCNVASPPFINNNVVTYIDYDLDVVMMPNGDVHVLDRDEYEQHKVEYHYSAVVQDKVERGLEALLKRIARKAAPFQDDLIAQYHAAWKISFSEKG